MFNENKGCFIALFAMVALLFMGAGIFFVVMGEAGLGIVFIFVPFAILFVVLLLAKASSKSSYKSISAGNVKQNNKPKYQINERVKLFICLIIVIIGLGLTALMFANRLFFDMIWIIGFVPIPGLVVNIVPIAISILISRGIWKSK